MASEKNSNLKVSQEFSESEFQTRQITSTSTSPVAVAEQQTKKSEIRLKNPLDMLPCGVYPFVEGPVYFTVADHYGIRLFLDLHKEFCCGLRDNNYGHPLFYDVIPGLDRWKRDDVYVFSSQEDLINQFFMDNLF